MNAPGPILPPYLASIERIAVDADAAGTPLAKRVRERLPLAALEVLELGQAPQAAAETALLHLKTYRGKFLRFCPGTREYRCCGYRIAHIGENCPIGCAYCILQAYFQDSTLRVWANQEDLFVELDQALSAHPGKRFRLGTGEFTDSLVLEPVTGYSGDLVEFLGRFDNACLELKSKTADLSWLGKVRRPERVLPAWSMNAPEIVARFEGQAASLEERLAAAKACAEQGFRVCLHFDPVIRFPGWRKGYAETAAMIFDHLRPEHIAYVSMGSFRFMPELKTVMEERHPDATFVYGEFVAGLDGKQRLLRPQRVEQLRFVASELRRGGLDEQLYLCMESDEVWDAVLGRRVRDLAGGLSGHLLNRAFGPETA